MPRYAAASNSPDPVLITQQLVRTNTVNPPGNEASAVDFLCELLEPAGFEIRTVAIGDGRSSLVARLERGEAPWLCFSGHLDTVPLGDQPWEIDPFSGTIRDGKLYGRGASDMKAGVATLTSAAISSAGNPDSETNLLLLFSAGEETGCEGAQSMADTTPELADTAAIIVAEPTDNTVRVGHKGALWVEVSFAGVTAHGAMPQLGTNAVYAAARAVSAIEAWGPEVGPVGPLGAPTVNTGVFRGGLNINSVPDSATISLDIRTVPGSPSGDLLNEVRSRVGEHAVITVLRDLPAVYTDSEHEWVVQATAIARAAGAPTAPEYGLAYFTDASVLKPAAGGAPTLFLGPGVPGLAHQTNEWCSVERIQQAAKIFLSICDNFTNI